VANDAGEGSRVGRKRLLIVGLSAALLVLMGTSIGMAVSGGSAKVDTSGVRAATTSTTILPTTTTTIPPTTTTTVRGKAPAGPVISTTNQSGGPTSTTTTVPGEAQPWSTMTTTDQPATLYGVSCTSPSFCVAVGGNNGPSIAEQ